MLNLKKALKRGMAEAEINQAELAKRIGRSISMMSLMINGNRSINLLTLEKIAAALGMKLSALIALGE